MAEYVHAMERLRSLTMEWTERYEEIIRRCRHVEYLYSNLDKQLPFLLAYEQHEQIQAQLQKIRQLARSLFGLVKSIKMELPAGLQVEGVQRIAGITEEYARSMVDKVHEACGSVKVGVGGRASIRQVLDNTVLVDLSDLHDRLRSFGQMQKFLDIKSQS